MCIAKYILVLTPIFKITLASYNVFVYVNTFQSYSCSLFTHTIIELIDKTCSAGRREHERDCRATEIPCYIFNSVGSINSL